MALKKKSSGGGGANWMDTYGDMVTLLLCFFVLLYSMSTISEENWKALVMSFNPKAAQTITETVGGDGPSADADDGGVMPEPQVDDNVTQEKVDEDIEALFQAIQAYIQETNQQSTITAAKDGGKIYISFGEAVFFDPESSYLLKGAEPVLDAVSGMLDTASNSISEVRVLGHTAQGNPNRPNTVKTDRTLSSQRAANVVIYIQEHSVISPVKLISEGIGQWRPVATNETSEGRAQNRRVEMIISGRDLQMEAEGVTSYYTATYTTTQ
nr:flagellar motor protein MotB [uncultured Oscillibacter sp.]